MAGLIGSGVSLRGIYDEGFSFPFNITGTVAKADVGKVVAQDITAANSAKLAGDNDIILGILGSFEDRTIEGIKVGAVYLKGAMAVPYVGTLAVGDFVCGSATAGSVKKAVNALGTGISVTPARVMEILAGNIAVILFV